MEIPSYCNHKKFLSRSRLLPVFTTFLRN